VKHFIALAVLAVALSTARFASGDPVQSPDAVKVQDRLDRAKIEAAAGHWDPAWDSLSAAWQIEQTPAIAAALGRAEVHLGMLHEAVRHLSFAIAGLSNDDPARAGAFADLEMAKQHLVTITVRVSPPGADVYVDGVAVGKAPLPAELYYDEGVHVVRAVMAGFTSQEQAVDGKMGSAHSLGLTLVPVQSLGRDGPRWATPIHEGRGRNKWVIAGGSLLGSATLAAGIGVSVAAATGNGDTAKMERLTALHFTAGAVVLGATLTYAFWPSRTEESTVTRVVAAPVPMDRGGGLALAGRF
jgi:PEGA domain-containing protein